ncbi:MAG: helix-turn-helix transcriptional regulator, partial [Actinocrinis sp.]
AGVAPLPEPLPVNSMLEQHFQRSIAALPDDTRSLLLLVAATPTDDRATLWRAAGALGLSIRAARPAVAAGILDRATAVEFRHPLIRSAVYSAASAAERRRIHAVLATTSAPDRRAWHLAESTDGADDDVAAQLEAASERAQSRGGYSEQALFLSRAAELTTDPARRAERHLGAAAANLTSGDWAAAQTLLDLATPDLLGSARARATRIRASVEMLHIRVASVPAMLLDAVAELGATDPTMSWELLYEATHAALAGGNRLIGTTLEHVAKVTADAWRDPAPPPWSADLLMEGLAREVAYGYPQGVPVIREALRRLRDSAELRELNSPLSVIVAIAADELWDIEAKREIVGRLAAVDRSRGALYGLTLALIALATTEISQGRFAVAEAYCAEADDYSAATGFEGGGDINRALLYAWTGKERELRAATRMMGELAETRGLGSLNRLAAHALGIFEIGRGRHREALGHLLPSFVEDTLPIGNLMLPLTVEAGIRAGDRPAAVAALERIEERAPLAGTPWALGSLARCRALASEGDDAEA